MARELISNDGIKVPLFAYNLEVLEPVASDLNRLGYKPDIVGRQDAYRVSERLLSAEKPPVLLCEDAFLKEVWGSLEALLTVNESCQVIVVATQPDIADCVSVMSQGALAYLPLPLNERELAGLLGRALSNEGFALPARAPLSLETFEYEGIIGDSPRTHAAMARLSRVAPTDMPVLILGENGTGKELAARAVHANSQVRGGPFVAVHVGAITETLIEGELFGWVKGAHSAATRDRIGYIEAADGGSLFLDELGDIPLNVQVKLLRVLETGELSRLGETRVRRPQFRLICATNKDLEALCREGTFREDLYYRIRGMVVSLPPLRERTEDIRRFVEAFVEDWNRRNPQYQIVDVPASTIEIFKSKPWNGNIRELKRNVEENAVLSPDGVLRAGEIPKSLTTTEADDDINRLLQQEMSMEDIQRLIVRRALELNDGNRKKTANQLQIPERTFYRMIKRFDLQDTV